VRTALVVAAAVFVPSAVAQAQATAVYHTATWPSGVPAGSKLWLQAWLAPSSGLCASDAIRGTTP